MTLPSNCFDSSCESHAGRESISRSRYELRLALSDEHPRQLVLAGGEVAFDGAEVVAGDGMLDGQRVLQAGNPETGALDVELISAHLDGLRDAQPVAIEHEQQRVVANAVAPLLGGLEQA